MMMDHRSIGLLILVFSWVVPVPLPPASAQETQTGVDYTRDIKPILKERCYACHGALKHKSKLRLDTAEFARKGGSGGPALAPGNPEKSLLIERILSKDEEERMPQEGAPLTEKDIALLKSWIREGAHAPPGEKPEDNPAAHWAFRRPLRPDLPAVKNAGWVRNPIDAFIALEHERRGLTPRPPADKPVLLRRVYLDLIGLPPTREELHAFLGDTSEVAYEKVVDRLLSSPQHGERWGRHWMDVWRYSDWYGRRSEGDARNSHPQIWRWRDWIIRSLNADKGYDRMVLEMLAADEIAPEDDEKAVATGYLVRTWDALNYNQWMRDTVEHTGKAFLGLTLNCAHCHDHKYDPITQEDYFRFRAFFEPLDLRQDRAPGEADPGKFKKPVYGVGVKIEPVRAGLVRVFDEQVDAKTFVYVQGDERNRVEGKPPVPPGVPGFLGGGSLKIEPVQLPPAAYYPALKSFVQQEEIARREKSVASAKAGQDKLRRLVQALALVKPEVEQGSGEDASSTPLVADISSRVRMTLRDVEAAARTAEAQLAFAEAELKSTLARIAADNAKFRISEADGDAGRLARAACKAERFAALCSEKEKRVQAGEGLAVAKQNVASGKPGKEKDQAAAELKKAEAAHANAVKAVETAQKRWEEEGDQYAPLGPVYPGSSTGRRRALARWIANRENPLTARVAVNHVWMRHFGAPLVDSVFNFGRSGKLPTHPELLDWMAIEFMESAWSLKRLHRLMVTSGAYRMQSTTGGSPETNVSVDSDNRFLWRFNSRRMEAEAVRDSILQVAGELDLQMGGRELEGSQEPASHRRSLYFSTHPEEGGHPKFLECFDPPNPMDCYRRSASIIPQQALALTNSRLVLDQSTALARKLWEQTGAKSGAEPPEPAFIRAAFEQILSRSPSDQELEACREFLRDQAETFRSAGPAADESKRARESLIRALFSHNDFVTIR